MELGYRVVELPKITMAVPASEKQNPIVVKEQANDEVLAEGIFIWRWYGGRQEGIREKELQGL